MTRDTTPTPDPEPHVFDQTNGVVDLGSSAHPADRDATRARTVSGIAMLSTQKP